LCSPILLARRAATAPHTDDRVFISQLVDLVVAMLTAALSLGATKAELIKYATSGDVSGDRNMVVGYAGIIVS